MESSSATEALLEKLRIEQRRLMASVEAERTDPWHRGDNPYHRSGAGGAGGGGGGDDSTPAALPPRAHSKSSPPDQKLRTTEGRQTGPPSASMALAQTRSETNMLIEIEALNERVRSLEHSLQYERERHAQTRELLRLALKPPPPEEANRIEGQKASPRGLFVDGSAGMDISAALWNERSAGGVVEMQQTEKSATYDRYEVYGPMTPSRVTQVIYDKAHNLDHPQSASKTILMRAQQQQGGGQLHDSPQHHDHHHHHHHHHTGSGSEAGGGGGMFVSGGIPMTTTMGGDHHNTSCQHHYHHGRPPQRSPPGRHGTPTTSGGGGGGSNRRYGTPSNASSRSAARPFGSGERRFASKTIVGEVSSYTGLHDRPVTDTHANIASVRRPVTPKNAQRTRSPSATTLRSPQTLYNVNQALQYGGGGGGGVGESSNAGLYYQT